MGRIINSAASQSRSRRDYKLCICGATDFIVVMQIYRPVYVYIFRYDNAGSVSLMKGILMRCGTQKRLLSSGYVLTPRLDAVVNIFLKVTLLHQSEETGSCGLWCP